MPRCVVRKTVTTQLGFLAIVLFLLAAAPAWAQSIPVLPPPPPGAAQPADAQAQPPRPVPEKVVLSAGTTIDVVLDTPMSTRISKAGQEVVFRTTRTMRLDEGLLLPPETAFIGSVTQMKKPGAFGKGGELRVKVTHIELAPDARTPLTGKLESADMDARGRLRGDSQSGANLLELAQWSLTGTIIGANYGGGKGAGYGAGAGALAALIIMMSRKGTDVYIEPGTPFAITLDAPLELAGQKVFEAQQAFDQLHPGVLGEPAVSSDGTPGSTSAEGIPASERPVLKRRPKPPKP
jgi:hypothetical protein